MIPSTDAESISAHLDAAHAKLSDLRFADALWNRRLDVWSSDAATQQQIATRLGWLSTIDFVTPHLPRVRAFAESIRADGFTDVVLLGMGGSSLAPEVIRQVLGVAAGFPRFRMLDSVDPAAVRDAMSAAETTLFVFASKSGGTIEPNVLAAEARRRVGAAGHGWGSRVIAITDDGTALHQRARAERYRDIFVNPSDIGGRYSVLSFFGIVPAALMGVDLDRFLSAARAMAQACRAAEPGDNPGLALGALMAAAASAGRDKLTLVVPDRLEPFGLWVEQLVAESTGKQGKGVIPIAGDSARARYGADRAAVAIELGDDVPDADVLARLRASGAPIATLEMPDAHALGAEFFRWEVATAAAGVLLGINPFDEPNVQQAKDATRALLDVYIAQKRLPVPEPHASFDGVRLTLSHAAQDHLQGDRAEDFLRVLRPGDYLGLLVYLPPKPTDPGAPLQRLRAEVAARTGCATMFGYGPRYLHSTGQLHKGGPNSGVFVIVDARPSEDLPIPGQPFSFGVLETAQALGDFASLEKARRRALLVLLPRPDDKLLETFVERLLRGLGK